MKENGKIIREVDMENIFIHLVMYILESGTMEKKKDLESSLFRKEPNIQVNGLKIRHMEKE